MASDPRYDFGRNWARYAERMPPDALEQARAGLSRHVGDLTDCTFLDVGSGSGLMSAAALSLGAARVMAFDYDEGSVSTSRCVLERLGERESAGAHGTWEVRRGDILLDDFGEWDVVYAWGVLHHTGDVKTALTRAASHVAAGGRLVVGIYMRTPMCRFWVREKRWYQQAPPWQRLVVRWVYTMALLSVWALKGHLKSRVSSHNRGMRLTRDIDDWLGGFPYESMTIEEINDLVIPHGFVVEAEFPLTQHMGWLGTGCQTVRYVRTRAPGLIEL